MQESTPQLCQHPYTSMKARGNRDQKWWTCVLCQSRWERMPMTIPTGYPTDDDPVTFGRHQGSTFLQIYQSHRDYAEWVLRTIESGDGTSPGLRRLGEYLVMKEAMQTNLSQPEDEQMPGR